MRSPTAWQRRARAFAAAIFLTSIVTAQTAIATEMAWIVVDVDTGRVLEQENAGDKLPPASLAKMMTLYLTFDAIKSGRLHWDDRIVVSRNASAKIPMKLWVKPGETISVREAINGMIVISANDAASAIGEHLAGSETAFARQMTLRGRQLGLRNTIFANASGLTDKTKQLTTARDMALLGLALKRDFPVEYRLFSQPSFVYRGKRLKGHNNLMYRYGGVDGIKTGYTAASGYNIVSSLSLGDSHLIGVVLGGKTARLRDNQMAALLSRFSVGEGTAVAAAEAAPRPAPSPRTANAPPTEDLDETQIEQGDGTGSLESDRPGHLIQVGALPNAAAAKAMIGRVDALVRSIEAKATSRIEITQSGARQLYKVRFAGFDDAVKASKACKTLRKHKFDCFVVEG